VVQYGGAVGRVGMRCVYVYVSDVRYVWEMVIRRCVLWVWWVCGGCVVGVGQRPRGRRARGRRARRSIG